MTERDQTRRPWKRGRRIVLGLIAILGLTLVWKLVKERFDLVLTLAARSDVHAIAHALEEYADNHSGAYPSTLEPLVAPDADGTSFLAGYNGHMPMDPWRREYHYEAPSPPYPKPHVWSYGADGKLGGTGEDADIDSEDL